jgi:hypothetical protein
MALARLPFALERKAKRGQKTPLMGQYIILNVQRGYIPLSKLRRTQKIRAKGELLYP